MPSLPSLSSDAEPLRVLLTGLGPYSPDAGVNQSWLVIQPLHNTIIRPAPHADPIILEEQPEDVDPSEKKARAIHVSVLQLPVTYEAILEVVPGLHARPPVVQVDDPTFLPPPDNGYDFIFHIGLAGRGPLRVERQGHKLGYNMKDATGKLASIVHTSDRRSDDPPEIEMFARERLVAEGTEYEGASAEVRPIRGFGDAYKVFSDELGTEIDALKLVHDLRRSGIEKIHTSMDAGHYLSDFIYFCSLAEARRTANPYEKQRNCQVLSLHCPPADQPLSTKEVTDAIKKIVIWVCSEIQRNDELDAELLQNGR